MSSKEKDRFDFIFFKLITTNRITESELNSFQSVWYRNDFRYLTLKLSRIILEKIVRGEKVIVSNKRHERTVSKIEYIPKKRADPICFVWYETDPSIAKKVMSLTHTRSEIGVADFVEELHLGWCDSDEFTREFRALEDAAKELYIKTKPL